VLGWLYLLYRSEVESEYSRQATYRLAAVIPPPWNSGILGKVARVAASSIFVYTGRVPAGPIKEYRVYIGYFRSAFARPVFVERSWSPISTRYAAHISYRLLLQSRTYFP